MTTERKPTGRPRVPRVEMPCPQCGTMVLRTERQISTGKNRFCGAACYHESHKGESHPLWLGPREACPNCGKDVERWKHQTFCSAKCKGEYRWLDRICETCGAEFRARRLSVERDGLGRFCSMACRGKAHAGPNHPRWKGGRLVQATGYVYVWVGDGYKGKTYNGSYVAEHRYVMEQKLGRLLAEGENVHHINGDKQDNRPENLELWSRPQPNGVRAADPHCASCTCFEV